MNMGYVWPMVVAFFCMNASIVSAGDSKAWDAYCNLEKKMEKSFETMEMVQDMDGHGMKAQTRVYKKGRKMRVENVIRESPNPMMGKPGQKTIVIDDGQTMWTFSPAMGKMSIPSDSGGDDVKEPVKVVERGRETVSGIPCIKVDVDYPDERKTMWISVKDSVLVKEEDREEERMTTLFSDFRKINGYPMAHKIETYEDGQLAETIKIQSIKINTRIDNALFDPGKIKGFDQAEGPKMKGQPARDAENRRNMEDVEKSMNMMQMAMEIQRLYQAGEVEKAQALEKKMQDMMQ